MKSSELKIRYPAFYAEVFGEGGEAVIEPPASVPAKVEAPASEELTKEDLEKLLRDANDCIAAMKAREKDNNVNVTITNAVAKKGGIADAPTNRLVNALKQRQRVRR